MWKFFATRLNGDGTETRVASEIPLIEPVITDDLSAPGGLTGRLEPVAHRMTDSNGEPVFIPWHTAIYGVNQGQIRCGAILDKARRRGSQMNLDFVGFSGYLMGQAYSGERSRVEVDPMDEARHIFDHVQSKRNRNIGLQLGDTKSPRRIGKPAEKVSFGSSSGDVEFESGPYKLNWWDTQDLNREFHRLAMETPFDYRVEHYWDGEDVKHRMVFGYPRLGRRLDYRFVEGENITMAPGVDSESTEYADHVIVLGAGSGRTMKRGEAVRTTSRLGRSVVITDKSLKSEASCNRRAADELRARAGSEDIRQVEVRNHRNAPLGGFREGDDILLSTRSGWAGSLDVWCRILTVRTRVQTDTATLTLVRAEKANR